jgi:hypothetical protein
MSAEIQPALTRSPEPEVLTNRPCASRFAATINQPHYTVDDVAKMLNMSRDSVTRLFRNEEGVLKIARPGNRYKRTYTTLRIPESVLNRVYGKMTHVN